MAKKKRFETVKAKKIVARQVQRLQGRIDLLDKLRRALAGEEIHGFYQSDYDLEYLSKLAGVTFVTRTSAMKHNPRYEVIDGAVPVFKMWFGKPLKLWADVFILERDCELYIGRKEKAERKAALARFAEKYGQNAGAV